MLEQSLLFTGCSRIQFFNSPSALHLTVQPLCVLRDFMPRHWSPSASHLTLLSVSENFPRGGKYPKNVPLSTFLAYSEPVKSIVLG